MEEAESFSPSGSLQANSFLGDSSTKERIVAFSLVGDIGPHGPLKLGLGPFRLSKCLEHSGDLSSRRSGPGRPVAVDSEPGSGQEVMECF